MTKLSANRAAKEAGIAKKTLLEAISSGRLSASKNDKGHWEIEPSELFRAYPKTGFLGDEKPDYTPRTEPQNQSKNSALEVEVKMLREQMAEIRSMNERERQGLIDQIETLKEQAERQSADHRQALAALTDQRETPKRSIWARLVG